MTPDSELSLAQLRALAPLCVVAATSFLTLAVLILWRNHRFTAVVTTTGLLAASALAMIDSAREPVEVTSLLRVDAFGSFFFVVIFLAGAFVAIMAATYLRRINERSEEFFLLVLTACVGGATLAVSTHFASFFLGLEVLSVSLYALLGYARSNALATEAALKYLILAGASSAVLVLGMALVYHELGTMQLMEMARRIEHLGASAAQPEPGPSLPLLLAGTLLVQSGVAFKLGLVPFHMWTPDIYQGTTPPAAALVATVSKASVLALVVRYVYAFGAAPRAAFSPAIEVIIGASMIVGNLLALEQRSLKRLVAYSSIAHLGYAVLPLLTGGQVAAAAVLYYLVAYVASVMLAFAVMSSLGHTADDADSLDNYRGLMRSRPLLAVALTTSMLSLAGIPLTAGFIGKFASLAAGIDANLRTLVVIFVATSAVGIYYYLRVVSVILSSPDLSLSSPDLSPDLVSSPDLSPDPDPLSASSAATRGTLRAAALPAVLVVLVIYLGIYPAAISRPAHRASGALLSYASAMRATTQGSTTRGLTNPIATIPIAPAAHSCAQSAHEGRHREE